MAAGRVAGPQQPPGPRPGGIAPPFRPVPLHRRVRRRSNIVGGCQHHRLEMSIPGGVSVVAGVANVAVQPTHTRQGIMDPDDAPPASTTFTNAASRWPPCSLPKAASTGVSATVSAPSTNSGSWNAPTTPTRGSTMAPGRVVFVEPHEIGQTGSPRSTVRSHRRTHPGVFPKPPHKWEEGIPRPRRQRPGAESKGPRTRRPVLRRLRTGRRGSTVTLPTAATAPLSSSTN